VTKYCSHGGTGKVTVNYCEGPLSRPPSRTYIIILTCEPSIGGIWVNFVSVDFWSSDLQRGFDLSNLMLSFS
jgi:hypothetical protein